VEKRRRVFAVAAHNPLSCASGLATMCSISVSRLFVKVRQVYRLQIFPRLSIMRSSTDFAKDQIDLDTTITVTRPW